MYPAYYFHSFGSQEWLDQVFVGMWFGDAHVDRWHKIIRPAIDQAGLKPFRVDMPTSADSIPIGIMDGIMRSRLVLFDVTVIGQLRDGTPVRNANVMYELGLAQAWRSPDEIVIIRSDDETLPFDMGMFRVKRLDADGHDRSREELAELLSSRLSDVDYSRTKVVERAVRLLDQSCLAAIHETKGHYFSIPQPENVVKRLAVARLLELGLIFLHASRGATEFAYHWTDLGREVITALGVELVPPEQS